MKCGHILCFGDYEIIIAKKTNNREQCIKENF